MQLLSKSDFVIHVTVEDEAEETEAPKCPEAVERGIGYLEKQIVEKGYEDFHHELVNNPRQTDRGFLYAEGTFAGPSPDLGELRNPEDFTEYHYIVVEDEGHFIIEVYFNSRKLAVFDIVESDLELLSGEIPPINE